MSILTPPCSTCGGSGINPKANPCATSSMLCHCVSIKNMNTEGYPKADEEKCGKPHNNPGEAPSCDCHLQPDTPPTNPHQDVAVAYDQFLAIARSETKDTSSTGIRSKMALDRLVKLCQSQERIKALGDCRRVVEQADTIVEEYKLGNEVHCGCKVAYHVLALQAIDELMKKDV